MSKFFLIFVLFYSVFKGNLSANQDKTPRPKIRKLINSITINKTSRNEEELDSIETCEASTFRFLNYYVTGQNVTFQKFINKDNAVSKT